MTAAYWSPCWQLEWCRSLTDIKEAVAADERDGRWGQDHKTPAAASSAAASVAAKGDRKAAESQHYFSKLYLPERGMFAALPSDLQLGTRLPVRGPSSTEPPSLLYTHPGQM